MLKKTSLYLLLSLIIFSCQRENADEIKGGNYFTLNGVSYTLPVSSERYFYPLSLNADTENDAYNLLEVNVLDNYKIYVDGVEMVDNEPYELRVSRLHPDDNIEIVVEDLSSGTKITSYIVTYPKDLNMGTITTAYTGATDKNYYYYYGYYDCIKINTSGDLIYFRQHSSADGRNGLFNMTELSDGTIYYSYLESVESSYLLDGVGYTTTKAVIMDKNYQVVDTVNSLVDYYGHPLESHQFDILDHNHYLTSAYVGKKVTNIPGMEGQEVYVVAAVVQEIKDGSVVFEWDSTDHTELYAYSQKTLTDDGSLIDYCHFNSAAIDPGDENFVMSFRQLSSIIKVDRSSGDVIWIWSGRDMDDGIATDTTDDKYRFLRQHDIKFTDDYTFTFFNNNSNSGKVAASMKAKITESGGEYYIESLERYDGDYYSTSMGSVQEISDKHYVTCWGGGATHLFTEKDYNTGTVLFEMEKTNDNPSYRVYKHDK